MDAFNIKKPTHIWNPENHLPPPRFLELNFLVIPDLKIYPPPPFLIWNSNIFFHNSRYYTEIPPY